MDTLVWDGHQFLAFARLAALRRSGLEFHRIEDASRFLRSLPHRMETLQALRQVLSESDASVLLARLSDEEVISRLAEQIVAGRIIITPSSRTMGPRPGLMSVLGVQRIDEQKLADAVQEYAGHALRSPVNHLSRATPLERKAGSETVHWRQALGGEADAVLGAIMDRTRSVTEALGELGMEVAKRLMGISTAPGFIKRYHGMDDICRDQSGNLVGMEAKGSKGDSTELAKQVDGCAQLSYAANRKRANKMISKEKKKDQPSSRQGGPYTGNEIKLYKDVTQRNGEKKLVSTHTDTGSGRTVIIERDFGGAVDEAAPKREFVMEGLGEATELFARRLN